MNAQQFGQNIKNKWPDGIASDGRPYSEIPDEEIARIFIAKNPIYKGKVSFVAPEKIARLRTEAEEAQKKASEFSVGKETAKEIGKTLIAGTVGTGESIGQSLAAGEVFENQSESERGLTEQGLKVLRQIRLNREEGRDTTRLEEAYNDLVNTPEASKLLPALDKSNLSVLIEGAETGLELLSGGSLGPAKTAVKETIKATAPLIKEAGKAVGGEIAERGSQVRSLLTSLIEERAAKKNLDYALDISSPQLSSTKEGEAISKSLFRPAGKLRKGKILPSEYDKRIAESISDVVSPKQSKDETVDAIRERLAQINSGVRGMVADRKIPFNKAQLRSRLNEGKEELRLIFASEKGAERIYNAVVDEFMRHVEKKDTLGLLDARQDFDKVPAIKKLLQTEGFGENTRKQIVLEVRNAANHYVSEHLPKNNPYRAALRKESKMIEALENIGLNFREEIGIVDSFLYFRWK